MIDVMMRAGVLSDASGAHVRAAFDPHKVTVTGRGVQANGVRVKDVAEFVVHTEGAGSADLSVKVTGPSAHA